MTPPQSPVLHARNLRVATDDGTEILHRVHFELYRGEMLGLVGETGAGKTTAGLACLAYYRPGLHYVSGFMMLNPVDGTEPFDIFTLDSQTLRSLRGRRIAYVAPDPARSLNPAMRVGEQIMEVLEIHNFSDSEAASAARVAEVLAAVELPSDETFQQHWPHELSSEQQQRVALAMAFVLTPDVVILDEPTTGLDAGTQAHILATIRRMTTTSNVASLYISRDPSVVAAVADRLAVMYRGEIVETGKRNEVLTNPEHPYTRSLVAAVPELAGAMDLKTAVEVPQTPAVATSDRPTHHRKEPGDGEHLIAVEGLQVSYGQHTVLHNIDLAIAPGECTLLVAETGAGKTTLARAIAGLLPRYKGAVTLRGETLARRVRRRTRAQRRDVQYIFSSPHASLNPRRSIGQSLSAPLAKSGKLSAERRRAMVEEALEAVQLDVSVYRQRPGDLSAEQRQRAAIARALVTAPSILICDEITAELDVTAQASIIALVNSLRAARGLTIFFLARDLRLARHVATRIAVLHQGEIVEHDTVDNVVENSVHSYPQALLSKARKLQRR